jgi:hypothetical protein
VRSPGECRGYNLPTLKAEVPVRSQRAQATEGAKRDVERC